MSDNPINHDQTYDASAEAPDNTHQQPDNVAPADSASHTDSDATADGVMQKASTLPTDDDIDMYAEEVEEEAIESLPPTIGTEASRLRLGGMEIHQQVNITLIIESVGQHRTENSKVFNPVLST